VHLIHITMKQREERKERAFIRRHAALIFLARRELERASVCGRDSVRAALSSRGKQFDRGTSHLAARRRLREKRYGERVARIGKRALREYLPESVEQHACARARINKTVGRRIVAYLAMKRRPSVAPSCGTCTVSRLHP